MTPFAYGFLAGIGACLSLGSVGWMLSCALWKWQHDKRPACPMPGPQRASNLDASDAGWRKARFVGKSS
jgi:hypothetical protein